MDQHSDDEQEFNWNRWYTFIILANLVFIIFIYFYFSGIQ